MKLVIIFLMLSLSFGKVSLAQNGSTAEQNEQAYLAYEQSNRAMVCVYKTLLKNFEDYDLDGAAKKALIAAQQAFISYRVREGEFLAQQFKGGSMLPTFKYKALKKLTDFRKKQLIDELSVFR